MTTIFGWLCLVLFLVSVGLALGVLINDWWAGQRQQALKCGEAKLQAEWHALEASQRMYTAFLQTRQAIQEEAIRQSRRPMMP